MTEPLPAKYAFSLYRGDSRVWEHRLNDLPAAWAASTAYVSGVVGSGLYLANSTVVYGADSQGVPVKWTCVTAHTSGATFDTTKWTRDPAAVGPPIDITGWLFESTYRLTTETAEDVAVEECEIIDAPDGVLRRTLIAEQAALFPVGKVAWDLQATEPDGTVRTILKNHAVSVEGDVTR